MKNTTPTAEPEQYTQVLSKADTELARLATEEQRLRLQMETYRAELQTLDAQARAHAEQKRVAQESIDSRRAALRQAETQAELSEGTLAAKPDLKGLEKLLKQAQTEQLVILDRIGKEAQANERRRLALAESIERHQKTLATFAERRVALEATKARVFAKQGEAQFQAHIQELNDLQNTWNSLQGSLAQTRQALDDMTRKAILSLKAWPEWQAQYRELAPFDDALTGLLEAQIALLNLALTSGKGAEIPMEITKRLRMRWVSLPELLSIDVLHWRAALAKGGSIEALKERKTQIQQIIATYREMQKR